VNISSYDHHVWYDHATQTVTCEGSLRLDSVEEYTPIVQLLNDAASGETPLLTLDLRSLRFLNSSGINVLSRFVIGVRQKGTTTLRVLGSQAIPWQSKSLVNLQRLMPNLQLEIE
jgi:hypothetical protein